MDKKIFINNFEKAIESLIKFTQLYTVNELYNKYEFYLYVKGDDGFYSEQILSDEFLNNYNKFKLPKIASFDGVIELLFSNDSVPNWIDLEVYNSIANVTSIIVYYSSLNVKNNSNLMHVDEGYPPFHCTSPLFPLNSKMLFNEDVIKFKLPTRKKY